MDARAPQMELDRTKGTAMRHLPSDARIGSEGVLEPVAGMPSWFLWHPAGSATLGALRPSHALLFARSGMQTAPMIWCLVFLAHQQTGGD